MAILKILKYPHPLLREMCEPVTAWDAALARTVDDMIETMYASPGAVGLAACQVGILQRVIVMDVNAKTDRDALKVLINPTIIEQSRNKTMREGCLSFPEYLANIKRATKLTFSAFDREGQLQTHTVYGLEAVAVQHEIDHLNGVLMIDRITSLKTDWVRRQAKPEAESGIADPALQGATEVPDSPFQENPLKTNA